MNSSEDFYLKLEEQLLNSSVWPSKYQFKFILKSNNSDISELESIFDDLKDVKISFRKSSNNNFTSVSLIAVMESPYFVIEKYKLASKIKGIISL